MIAKRPPAEYNKDTAGVPVSEGVFNGLAVCNCEGTERLRSGQQKGNGKGVFTMNQSSTGDERRETLKSIDLLAKGYEIVKDLTVPVVTSNKDLGIENSEPKNAQKLSIDAVPGILIWHRLQTI